MPSLRGYQKEALKWLTRRDCAALFADPGTGKTLIMLSLMERFRLLGRRPKVLLVAPIRVMYHVWPAEIEKWGFDFSWYILHGKNKTVNVSADIHLVNPEGLKWLAKQDLPDYDTFILDESSLFRNPTSVRMRIMKTLLPRFKHRYILTGTPKPKDAQDLWAQMYMIDLGESLGSRITHFRNAYCYHEHRNNVHRYHMIPGMDDVINRRIAHLCYRIDAETCLDLPPLIVNDIKVTLPKTARDVYDGMEKKLVAYIAGAKRRAGNASAAYGLCCQLASGAIYDEDSSDYKVIHDAKLQALAELKSELNGKPLLVVFRFRHEADRLQRYFKERTPVIIGGTSEATVSRLLAEWNKGELPMLAAQYQSISHGLNLQAGGNDIAWLSLADDYDVYEQLNRRIYRSGVRNTVRIHRLLADRTIDYAIAAGLERKMSGQQGLFDILAEYLRI